MRRRCPRGGRRGRAHEQGQVSERARGAAREGAGLRRDASDALRRGVGVAASRRSPLVGVVHAGCGSDAKELFTRPFDAGADADATDERRPRGRPDPRRAMHRGRAVRRLDRVHVRQLRQDLAPLPERARRLAVRRPALLQRARAMRPPARMRGRPGRHLPGRRPVHHRPLRRGHEGLRAQSARPRRRRRSRQSLRRRASDCDDLDPDVSSSHAEVCGNGKDDNCNGDPRRAAVRHPGERRLRDRAAGDLGANLGHVPPLDRGREAGLRDDELPSGADADGLEGRRPEDRRPARRRRRTSRSGRRRRARTNEVAVALRRRARRLPACKSASRGRLRSHRGLAVRARDRAQRRRQARSSTRSSRRSRRAPST